MRKKRISLRILFVLVCAVLLQACSTQSNKSVAYHVDTGDSVKITVDTKAGYDLTMEVPFSITKGDTEIITGSFIYAEYYEVYYESVSGDANAVILEEGSKDGNDFFFYSYDGNAGTEYNYIVMINGSNTAVILYPGKRKLQKLFMH